MPTFLILIIALAAGAGITAFILILQRKKDRVPSESFLMIQQQLNHLSQIVDNKLSDSTKAFQEQFNQNKDIIRDITKQLTRLDETNKQVISYSEQLQSLEDILKNPKQRGILGEYFLEEVLKNVFPPSQYQMQYSFRDGQTVDAVIFVGKNKMIPVDSKFSLENYNRLIEEKDPQRREELEKIFKQDLKNRIDETAKYIRPQEGTLDFALMFIPAEAIYYDLLVNKIGAVKSNTRDLIEYAVREKKVHIVSPTSFYAYLQTIIQGLRAMQIEQSAKEIRKRVEQLARHLLTYDEYLKKLGANLAASVGSYNKAYKEFGKIDKDVVKIIEKESKIEVQELERPIEEFEEI